LTNQLASSAPNVTSARRPPTRPNLPDDSEVQSFDLALRAAGRRPKTIQTYSLALAYLGRFAHERGMPPVSQLTAEHLREWFRSLYEQGCQGSTVSVYYRAAAVFYKWLVAEGERPDNPLSRIPPPRVEVKIQAHYTPEDVALVLKRLPHATRDWRALRNRAIVLTLYDTGLRGAELCGLRREDLDLRDLGLRVQRGKGGKWREVAVSALTAQAIDRYLRNRNDLSLWLFVGREAEPLTVNGLKMMLERLWSNAGLAFRGVHAFRRGFAIQFLEAGGDPEDLRTLAGWDSHQMLRRYTKATETQRAKRAHAKFSPVQALGLGR
jgi:integrase/recombinase XerD